MAENQIWAYSFAETDNTDPVHLGEAFAAQWEQAAEHMRDPERSVFVKWVQQFGADRGYNVATRDLMIDVVEGDDAINFRLLSAVRWLAPSSSAAYAGAPLNAETLWSLSSRAASPGADAQVEAAGLCREIADYQVLRELACVPGGVELGRIEERRTRAAERWAQEACELSALYPGLTGRLDAADPPSAEIMNIAVDEERAARRLDRAIIAGERCDLALGVPRWFAFLRDRADADAVRLLAVLWCLPEAAEQVNHRIAGAAAPEQAQPYASERPEPQNAYQATEEPSPRTARVYPRPTRQPVPAAPAAPEPEPPTEIPAFDDGSITGSGDQTGGGRAGAVFFALLGIAGVALIWLLYLWLPVPAAQLRVITWAIALALVGETMAECTLAGLLGRDYHPDYALLPAVGRFFQASVGRLVRQVADLPRGGLFRAVLTVAGAFVALLILGSLAAAFSVVVPLAALVGHVGWAYMRWYRWSTGLIR
ncbi:hypothetical protein [Actinomadura harenae]|uniref:Uncharacterized protein n=1 Tax=Actinomadura harenae TaxID=2483351 RepID=A0A3M2LLA2_9ACTN|nr:hypothetical protein [Actinomadura harenae]RMI38204.1 hypothetical protein EBO15_33570 [Actinomadura harenae]